MLTFVKMIFRFGPLLFGIGFLAPLSAQVISTTNWTPPLGVSPLTIGLVFGGMYGLLAQIRGRWV
ncbi:MAG: hypothetical protein AAF216_10900 [Pseudomonadota bacterium]